MNERQASPEHDAGRNARALVVVTCALMLVGLAPLAVGLLGGIVLYEVCAPPYTWLARRLSPHSARALTIALVIALVAVPAFWFVEHLVMRVPAVSAAIAGIHLPGEGGAATGLRAQLDALTARAGSAAASWLPGQILALGGGAAWALMNWSIALLGLYYLLGSASTSWEHVARVLPFSATGAETLRVRLRETTRGIVAGTMLSAAAQGVSIGAGFWLAGLPESAFWGVVGAIATLVPVVGNILVWGPGLVVVLLDQHYAGAVAIGVFGGLMPPVISRVVQAGVSRRVGGVHPMITLVGALAGIRVAGVAGLVMGPVALAMFFSLLDVYRREYVAGRDATGA
jgi:predicted PurR-regulated permease PerM